MPRPSSTTHASRSRSTAPCRNRTGRRQRHQRAENDGCSRSFAEIDNTGAAKSCVASIATPSASAYFDQALSPCAPQRAGCSQAEPAQEPDRAIDEPISRPA